MNYDEAREYAKYTRGQDSDALYMFPAQEFLRVEPRRVPRTDWQTRWRAAGGKLYGGRMVALKSSDVWKNLSRFDRPYPPFDFGSGMGVEDIDRDEAIELGLLPKDEPVDEIPDFDDALETEVSLERIPEDLVKEIAEKTPNCEIRGDKLVMRSKPPLPTFADAGLESAKTWKPSIRETIISKSEAEKKLADGFTVKDVLGNPQTFSDETIHWRNNSQEKYEGDTVGRLVRLPMAEMCITQPEEIWQLPNNRMRNYIMGYVNMKGQFKGVAVSVKPDGSVHTYYVQSQRDLDKFRKGECIYKR